MDIALFQNSPSGRLVRTVDGYWAFVPNPLPPKLDWSDALVEQGMLAEITGGKRNKAYAAKEILAILEEDTQVEEGD